MHRNYKWKTAYLQCYYRDRLYSPHNLLPWHYLYPKVQWRNRHFRVQEKFAISHNMCSLCLIGFLMPDLLFLITRHIVGVFGLKFLNAVSAGGYLTATEISGPFFFLDHSEFDEVRKCVCTHTCTHTDTNAQILRLHTKSRTRPRGCLVPFLHTSLPSLAFYLSLLPYWCENCLQCRLSLRKVYLRIGPVGWHGRTRENNRRSIHFLIPLVLSSGRPWHIR